MRSYAYKLLRSKKDKYLFPKWFYQTAVAICKFSNGLKASMQTYEELPIKMYKDCVC